MSLGWSFRIFLLHQFLIHHIKTLTLEFELKSTQQMGT